MKLLIDTTQNDLFISIVNEKTIDFLHIEDLKKKSSVLSEKINDLLSKNKLTINDIKEIFVTTGPGSFMGARAALIYARTICQLSNIELYTANSFELFALGKDGEYFGDAKGGDAYVGKLENGKWTFSVGKSDEVSVIDYKKIIEQPNLLLDQFKKTDLDVVPNYVKEPRIGGM